MNGPSPLLADAILPSLIWIWPITVVLLLPIIVVEAQYARRRLNLMPGQAFRVFAVANVISTVIGFPLATVAYVNWWIARRSLAAPAVKSQTALVVRNANVLSYALLAAISIGLLAWISR